MRALDRLVPLLLPLLLGGCGALAPFEAAPPGALPGGGDGVPVSVCYSRLASTAEAVRAVAAEACHGGGTPRLVGSTWDLAACPVLTPARAVFACGP
jgi:hypothetical protein